MKITIHRIWILDRFVWACVLTLVPYPNSYKSVYMQLCITFFQNKLNNTIHMHIHTNMPANFYTYSYASFSLYEQMQLSIHTSYIHTVIYTSIQSYIDTYNTHTYIHAYIHTHMYIHTYIHTYNIHTYTHVHTVLWLLFLTYYEITPAIT